jgi:hypothetical protein
MEKQTTGEEYLRPARRFGVENNAIMREEMEWMQIKQPN